MSASQEKRRRQAEKVTGVDKRELKQQEETREKKRVKKYAVIIAVVVVFLLAVALFINSNFVRRNLTALTINDVNYTVTDFNYYYYDSYYTYLNSIYSSFSDYASEMLPSTDKPFGSQIYDEETGKTWADFFDEMALGTMKEDAVIYSEAVKAGFELPEDKLTAMEEEIENLKTTTTSSGSFKTLDDYLKSYYGAGMDEASFRRVVKMKYIVDAYGTYVKDSYTYTDEEIEANYTENSDMFDVYDYRYFLVYADKVEEADYDDTAAYEEANAAALAEAKTEAEGYAAKITTEKSFMEMARTYDAETYAEDDSTFRSYKGELLGSIYGTWLRDASRKAGDVTTAETSTGYYVVYYLDRSDNHYDTVNARIITVIPEEIDSTEYAEDEDSTAYDKAVQDAFDAASTEAHSFYKDWTDTGATEEDFIALFAEHSDETTNEEGLYENIYKNQFATAMNAWLYDSSRKEGDHTVIESDKYVYVVYFKGTGEQYSTVLSGDDLRKDEYDAWVASLGEGVVKTKWNYALVE